MSHDDDDDDDDDDDNDVVVVAAVTQQMGLSGCSVRSRPNFAGPEALLLLKV